MGNPDVAGNLLLSGIPNWLRRLNIDHPILEWSGIFKEIETDEELGIYKDLIRRIALNPELPLVLKDKEVTLGWFQENRREGVKLLKTTIPKWLSRLKGDKWLEELRQELHQKKEKYWPRVKRIHDEVSEEKVDELLIQPVEDVIQEVVDWVEQYRNEKRVHVSSSGVNQLLEKGELNFEEGIVLLANRALFVTEEFLRVYRAAEQEDADAQSSLGFAYTYGLGVEQDEAEAVKWYRKAADQGHEEAKKFGAGIVKG